LAHKSRVFVVQQPRPNNQGWTPNLGPATQYGAIHFVFSGSDRPQDDTRQAMIQAAERLQDFDPTKDFVVWPYTGDPAGAWAVMLVLGNMDIDYIRVLCWQRKLENGERNGDGFYTPLLFDLDLAARLSYGGNLNG
jgi:hypothetical protein